MSPQPDSPDDLNQAFREVIEHAPWQVDVPDGPPIAESSRPDAADGSIRVPADPAPPEPPAHAAQPARPTPTPVQIVEALLFIGSGSLGAAEACRAIRGFTPAQFQECVDALQRRYRIEGRPYWIENREGGFALVLRPRYARFHERMYGGAREARLSTAALEALAVVAYRQPVTKQEVDSLRGHDSGALLRQLVRRGLIAVTGRAESGGRDVLYGTTPRFFELFGLSGLEDLPETEDLQRL